MQRYQRAVVFRTHSQLEQAHSEERRNLLKYDDILHSQRTSVYEWRQDLLELPCSDLVAALIDQCQDSETTIKSWEGFLERWSSVDSGVRQSLERQMLLRVLDTRWAGHLEWLQDLREDVSLERFAQRDPLMEYRRRAVDRFADLEKEICEASITQVCALQPPETRPEIVFPKPARPGSVQECALSLWARTQIQALLLPALAVLGIPLRMPECH